jgi:hypothetical protein
LIQEHFNGEKWMNSEAYPLFVFAGRIADLSKVNFSKNGTYTVPVSGKPQHPECNQAHFNNGYPGGEWRNDQRFVSILHQVVGLWHQGRSH